MWNLNNIVTQWMLEWQLISEAAERSDVKIKAKSISKQVIKHLVKIYKFKNPIDLNHHCNDINTWLGQIDAYEIKGGKRPTFKDYYEWIYETQKTSIDGVKSIVNSLDSYTKNLQIIRTDAEVANVIQHIMYHVCLDLSNKDFDDIRNYIEKYPPYSETIVDVGDDEDFKNDEDIDDGYEYNYDEELYHRMGW